ncbi:Chitotriosidase-1 [Nymphon striatum]|nr:Chitotriosidase-1 [Nymphon striatum]
MQNSLETDLQTGPYYRSWTNTMCNTIQCAAVLSAMLASLDSYDYCAEENLPQRRIVCYYDNANNKYYGVDDVNPCLCTHLVYSHVTFDPANNWTLVSHGKLNEDYKDFHKLKKKNPWLMTMVSLIGGQHADVSANGTDLKIVADKIINFIGENHLDGVDVDLQGMSSGSPVEGYMPEKTGLNSFIKTLRESLDASIQEDDDPFLLSLTVSKNPHEMVYGYDIDHAIEFVDFFNLPAYNFTNATQPEAIHPSRLHGIADIENADTLVDFMLTLGVPSNKLVVGVPTHGYTYTLLNSSAVEPGSPISGAGKPGDISNTAGFMTHEEICMKRNSQNWTVVREQDQTAPYMYNGNQWIGFDDEMSIKLKTKYIVLRELGGINVVFNQL